jgi:lipopolysaccharide transport system ATP-binding protein
MTDVAIKVEGLSKQYRIGKQVRYKALRDVITDAAAARFHRLRSAFARRPQAVDGNGTLRTARGPLPDSDSSLCSHQSSLPNTIWALHEVSFEVKRGEVVGIIGRNGAGKSTLLKILSRITKPTRGHARIHGRVGSLLEVGTGFHPELTGRENIYLNAAILGMRRAEIDRKFDEIVAFAEVEKFIDTPVKRYSSGMYVRLAFAVAAHMETEILLVDEVLAVGDSGFQKKCLGKMDEAARQGRTVVFVSHNMNAVETLCTRAFLLERGCIQNEGANVRSVINGYLKGSSGEQVANSAWVNEDNALDHATIQPLFFAVLNADGQPVNEPVRNDESLFVLIRADVRQLDPALNAGFALFNQDSELLLWSLTTDGPENEWPRLERGAIELRCALPLRFLNEGTYRLELSVSLHCREWIVQPGHNSPAVHFEIRGGLSDSPYWTFARPGLMAPEWEWERVL